ncbi:hypothetical protein HBA54_09115 [Pelagibius litoralis]|uniref:Uncharacterized protein n=1 Tax=Pelagibius litoralis TaxID=374515 RepID=A0A967EVY8_9PROT|nr:hypothetical protein [Pelagibius litoralis]NIA68749.1 hypothetical protein [Pelagibius litoralis]
MTLNRISKGPVFFLTLALTATAAMAHDQTDCTLAGEQVCDEAGLSPIGWENCAWIASVECYGHSHVVLPGTKIDKFQVQREDHQVQRKIEQKVLKLKKAE